MTHWHHTFNFWCSPSSNPVCRLSSVWASSDSPSRTTRRERMNIGWFFDTSILSLFLAFAVVSLLMNDDRIQFDVSVKQWNAAWDLRRTLTFWLSEQRAPAVQHSRSIPMISIIPLAVIWCWKTAELVGSTFTCVRKTSRKGEKQTQKFSFSQCGQYAFGTAANHYTNTATKVHASMNKPQFERSKQPASQMRWKLAPVELIFWLAPAFYKRKTLRRKEGVCCAPSNVFSSAGLGFAWLSWFPPCLLNFSCRDVKGFFQRPHHSVLIMCSLTWWRLQPFSCGVEGSLFFGRVGGAEYKRFALPVWHPTKTN